MCGISSVAGAAGGGPPGKPIQADVAGAAGSPAQKTDVAGAAGGGADATQAGAGAAALGGGAGDLASVLKSLTDAVTALAAAVQKMGVAGGGGAGGGGCGMHGVMGVQGKAAAKSQFVAKNVTPVNTGKKEDNAFEQRVLELINKERAKYGLGAVTYNGVLDNAAEKHASHMSVVGKMAHEGIGDGDPGERIRAEGFRNAWGENVATGQTSPEQVVREWMASPEHRRNILDPDYQQMGVGYVTAANGRSYWAQEFGA
jgi:uncharacterized protein YkwD